jgi:molybdenum cofactor guanylyltransferase
MKTAKIYGLILAGGRGSRMDGVDKGLAQLNGEPLIALALKALSSQWPQQVDQIIISANRHLETYAALTVGGRRVIVTADLYKNYQGPLAGMHAGLQTIAQISTQQNTPPDYVMVMPTDTPHAPECLVARLFTAISKASANCAYSCAYVTVAGAMHPLTCMVSLDVLPSLEQFLSGDDRRVRNWIARLNSVAVPFDDYPKAFANYNTVEQLLNAKQDY